MGYNASEWELVNKQYKRPCASYKCNTWNPSECASCDIFLRRIANCAPNWGSFNELLESIERYFGVSVLYTWEDYESTN